MKNIKVLEKSLDRHHFHPLNFFVPIDIKQIKPYEIMEDGSIVSVFSFYSESQKENLFLKVTTSEHRQEKEDLTYKVDNKPA